VEEVHLLEEKEVSKQERLAIDEETSDDGC
jgi:hypothetical protein